MSITDERRRYLLSRRSFFGFFLMSLLFGGLQLDGLSGLMLMCVVGSFWSAAWPYLTRMSATDWVVGVICSLAFFLLGLILLIG